MKTQIKTPIYRGLKLGTENEYVIGFLKNCTDTGLDIFWIQDKDFIDYRVDIDTLSINFPNTIDSEGNKIFASLSEDGKGGDILQGSMQDNFREERDNGLVKIEKGLLIIECRGSKRPFNFESGMGWQPVSEKNYNGFKVIGIKQ